MSKTLKEQLSKTNLTLNMVMNINEFTDIPSPVINLIGRFAAMYEKNSSHFNIVIDSDKCELIPIEQYGEYIKELCLDMDLPSDYEEAVGCMYSTLALYIDNFLSLARFDDELLASLDEIEYKEELVDKLSNNGEKYSFFTWSEYEELVQSIEDNDRFQYNLDKE